LKKSKKTLRTATYLLQTDPEEKSPNRFYVTVIETRSGAYCVSPRSSILEKMFTRVQPST